MLPLIRRRYKWVQDIMVVSEQLQEQEEVVWLQLIQRW